MKDGKLNITFVDNLPDGMTFADLKNTPVLDSKLDWDTFDFADYFDSDDFYDFVDEFYSAPTWALGNSQTRAYAEELDNKKKK